MSFVHLHVHSEYSLLDGFSNLKKLVQRVKEMGMPAVALTDHGTMFGVIDFYNAATEAGIKPIIGVEAYLAARSMYEHEAQADKKSTHLLLLAENETGYRNLLKIASAAQLDGFYYYPRIDHDFLAQHAEGLICTSGCMSAEIPRLIQQDNVEAARKQMDWYFQVFGPERFFLELQNHDIKELAYVNKTLIDLGKRYPARFVATNDVHYINQEDARYQDIMLAIQTGCVLSDPNRLRMTDNTYYLRDPQEMASLFAEVPEALSNTLWIAERCSLDLGFKGYHLPQFPVPEGYTPESYLRKLCEQGLIRRYGPRASDPALRQRLDDELSVIHQMDFDTYFLIVYDLCDHASKAGIWYNARGSAAGSIVAYTLDITMVDPIEHGLIFERFLNPGRIEMPDIDLDFQDDRRAEMLEYTAQKYGNDKVAQIITFGTLGARAAIRDVGRVMDIPLTEVDKVAKLIPNIPGKPATIEQVLDEIPDFKQMHESTDYLRELIDTARHMEGVVRNAGTHAAGVIITDKPVIDYVPLHRPTGSIQAEDSPIKTVTQFEMSVIGALGLLKVDFLGLATLTIMARACELIRQRHGIDLNLANIPVDDPATYELLGRGETAGVFQVEGSGMRRWLMQMKPKDLSNVVAMVALFRPGPMDFIPGYIRRMHGEEKVDYRHPLLEPIFKETYGVPVYQEQIMFAAVELAGYTPSEADDLRKAIAKKIKDKLLKHRAKFVRGAVKKGIPEETAGAIFDDWEEFARYGFNKAHAADYGVIAVQTAYLKTHYTVEYMTALLSVTKNQTDKVALYVADCRRMGIAVEPPDINCSDWDFTIEDHPEGKSSIRFSLGAVKNVGYDSVETILQARLKGQFTDINDFARRADLRRVGKRSLECLIRVGALDDFGARPSLLAALDRILSVSTSHFRAADMGQMSLFGMHTGVTEEITLPKASGDISRREILNWEKELIGLYVSDHPLSPVMEVLNHAVTHFSGQLGEAAPNERVRVAGLITRIRPHQTKAGKAMGFVTLEDIQGNIELVVFPRAWEQYADILDYDRIVLVDGKVDAEGAEPKVLVDTLTTELTTYEPLTAQKSTRPAEPKPSDPPASGGLSQQPDRASETRLPDSELPMETWEPSGPSAITEDWEEDGVPPPPEAFPPDWNPRELVPGGFVIESGGPVLLATETNATEPQDHFYETLENPSEAPAQGPSVVSEKPTEEISPATSSDPALPIGLALNTSPVLAPIPNATPPTVQELSPAPPTILSNSPPDPEPDRAPVRPVFPYILTPTGAPDVDGEDIRMITVMLRSTGDKVRDNVRMRQAYGMLISYPGHDRFAFQVYERGRGYQIEFPNFTTGLNPELLNRLQRLVGPESVLVTPLTFH